MAAPVPWSAVTADHSIIFKINIGVTKNFFFVCNRGHGR